MNDLLPLAPAIFSAIATVLAAFATWQAPRAAAKLAEALRRDADRAHERHRNKLQIFALIMQERSEIYSDEAVKALNLIDVVFSDAPKVRDSWAELFSTFNTNPIPLHFVEERLRKLLITMAEDIGFGDTLRTDDFGRFYMPLPVAQGRMIRRLQREQLLSSLTSHGSPATNTAAVDNTPWPPKPE